MDDNDKFYNIKDFDQYRITKSGKVWSMKHRRFLKPELHNTGYYRVTLWSSILNHPVHVLLHRLIAQTFIPNPRNLPYVNHKDGNKKNCSISNLEWCTAEYNTRHAIKTGLIKTEEDSAKAKLTKQQVFEIYDLHDAGFDNKEIAIEYDVSDTLIKVITRGERWTKAYKEYYGHDSSFVRPKRKKIPIETIRYILNEYYFNGKNTVELEKELNIANSYIGGIVRGKYYNEEFRKLMSEIKKRLDNQQPHAENDA